VEAFVNEPLNKYGQLLVIVVGYFATVLILIVRAADGSVTPVRALLSLLVALACAVRYWWVVLLLPWPFHWFRLVLILSAWSLLPVMAITATDARRWAFALAILSAIGCVTETFNGVTGQWRVGSPSMTASLRRDHVSGAVTAAAAAGILFAAGTVATPSIIDRLVVVLVIADWIRLVWMIRRHQRLLTTDGLT
jgi:hypothetical protein